MLENDNNWYLGDIADFYDTDGLYWGKVVIFAIREVLPGLSNGPFYKVTLVSDERFTKPENDTLKVGDKFEARGLLLKRPNRPITSQIEELRTVIREIVKDELYSSLRKVYCA